ncbi:9166_t:CDS:2 [Paraglomus occultum]|uniref:9166_t:CDS:1 n=1 Tax=Paraglomus occultum TaxID=144539 RepID=A0A9N8W5Y0_9GLOM|nr:9166_t:CDS:2 [Paraglomus occultum]
MYMKPSYFDARWFPCRQPVAQVLTGLRLRDPARRDLLRPYLFSGKFAANTRLSKPIGEPLLRPNQTCLSTEFDDVGGSLSYESDRQRCRNCHKVQKVSIQVEAYGSSVGEEQSEECRSHNTGPEVDPAVWQKLQDWHQSPECREYTDAARSQSRLEAVSAKHAESLAVRRAGMTLKQKASVPANYDELLDEEEQAEKGTSTSGRRPDTDGIFKSTISMEELNSVIMAQTELVITGAYNLVVWGFTVIGRKLRIYALAAAERLFHLVLVEEASLHRDLINTEHAYLAMVGFGKKVEITKRMLDDWNQKRVAARIVFHQNVVKIWITLSSVTPPLPPPPFQPPQQQRQEEEMSQASYPTFDGTNSHEWIAELELAFIANNIPNSAHDRKMGIAALNLGPAKMWFITLANKPTTWAANQGVDGFKELFLARYATNGNRAQASQQAYYYMRMQMKTESVNDYLNALQEMWLECGDPALIPEWTRVNQFVHGLLPMLRTPVLQQAPETMAQAIKLANNCFYAMRASVQPSHSAEVNDALLEKIALLEVQLAELKTSLPNNRNNGPKCHYCGNNGHMHRDCRIKTRDIRQGRKLNWTVPRQL